MPMVFLLNFFAFMYYVNNVFYNQWKGGKPIWRGLMPTLGSIQQIYQLFFAENSYLLLLEIKLDGVWGVWPQNQEAKKFGDNSHYSRI